MWHKGLAFVTGILHSALTLHWLRKLGNPNNQNVLQNYQVATKSLTI